MNSIAVPRHTLQLRPPGLWRASRRVQSKAALRNSQADTNPAIPAPGIMTVFRLPTSGGKWNEADDPAGSESKSMARISTNAAEYPPAFAARQVSSRLVIPADRKTQQDFHPERGFGKIRGLNPRTETCRSPQFYPKRRQRTGRRSGARPLREFTLKPC